MKNPHLFTSFDGDAERFLHSILMYVSANSEHIHL